MFLPIISIFICYIYSELSISDGKFSSLFSSYNVRHVTDSTLISSTDDLFFLFMILEDVKFVVKTYIDITLSAHRLNCTIVIRACLLFNEITSSSNLIM